jgi:hypothetical protein
LLAADARAVFGVDTPALLDADAAALPHAGIAAAFDVDPPAFLDADASAFDGSASATDVAASFGTDAFTLAELAAADAPSVPARWSAPTVADAEPIAALVKARAMPAVVVPAVFPAPDPVLDLISQSLVTAAAPIP